MPKAHKPIARLFSSRSRSSSAPAPYNSYYRQKCKDIKKRIAEIEKSNQATEISLERKRRGLQRMRIERALMMEQIAKHDSELKSFEGGTSRSQGNQHSEDTSGSRSKDKKSESSLNSGSDSSDSMNTLSPPTTVGEEDVSGCCSG